MNKTNRIIPLTLSAILLIALFLPVSAVQLGTGDSGSADVIAAYSSNVNTYAYEYNRWATVINSYLYKNEDGGISRVECVGKRIFVEDYDSSYNFITGRQIEKELPLFGGFYSGANYNYLVFGQSNMEEDPAAEVFRIVKYSKSWERLASASLYGANTQTPFASGSLRMLENGGYLFVRTSQRKFKSSDGLNHQSNITIKFNIETNEASTTSAGYTSHSFNQFIVLDGGRIVTSDHGDAYPRGIVITRYNTPMVEADEIVPMGFMGSIGQNDTGATLGGFESTSVGYMAAGNANPGSLDRTAQRNIYLIVTPRDNFTASSSQTVWLTSYDPEPNTVVDVSIPHLVKINDDKLVVIWTENNVVKYAFVNANGELLGDIVTDNNMRVSDCQPILDGDRVLWYVTSNTQPTFYYIYAGDDPAPDATPVPAPAGKTAVYSINGDEFTLSHTAELYYDITDLIGSDKRVAIACLQNGSEAGAVLSIINIKFTSAAPSKNSSGEEPRAVCDEELVEFVEAVHYGILGDADHDGRVCLMDALAVMRSVLSGTSLGVYGAYCADTNGDGAVDMTDALGIMRLLMNEN